MPSGGSGRRVLVVEDEAVVGMLLHDMLTLLGARTIGPAGSVGRALALLEAEAASLDGAILDIKLGREDVYPVADRLRMLELPFIFLTGYGLPAIPRGYADAPVIEKPFELSDLETLLTRHVPPRPRV
jgi:CheY-like chemotaxis protein